MPLTLTTVWFFPHRERLVLVHHGSARLAEEDAADIARVVLGADRSGALRPAEEFHAVMVKRADTKGGAIHALRDEDLVPAEWLAPPCRRRRPDAPSSAGRVRPNSAVSARARKRAERELAATRERFKARGLDPDKFSHRRCRRHGPLRRWRNCPPSPRRRGRKRPRRKPKALAELEAKKADAAARLAAAGMPDEEIQKRLNPKVQGPPAFSAAAARAQMAEQITAMRVLGQLTLELEARMASPEFAEQLEQAEAGIRNSYRLVAHLQDPADALPAERSAEIRRLIAADTAAARALYDLHGADLSGARSVRARSVRHLPGRRQPRRHALRRGEPQQCRVWRMRRCKAACWTAPTSAAPTSGRRISSRRR